VQPCCASLNGPEPLNLSWLFLASAPSFAPDPVDVETGAMVEPVRHRQTKEAATDMFYLKPPRHISTLLGFSAFGSSHCSTRKWSVDCRFGSWCTLS